ncbi:MAG: NADP-specific glutamate dehydrogenase [Acholeplasmataceae bacterium]
MLKSKYLNRVFDDLKNRHASEPEFLQAVEEFFESMEVIVERDPSIERYAIMERIVVPERVIKFRVSWTNDAGEIKVNTGYRIQHNSAIGPYKGGIRFVSNVNESVLKFLGFEQTFKNSLTGLPLGGGKGGADFDPRGKSDNEIQRFCQSYMAELYRHLGPDTDVPAGDIGVGAREIGYMFGMYKKLTNEFTGVLTGKGLSYGGSLGRREATGYGLCYFVEEMLTAYRKDNFEGKRIIISGAGKVGKHAAIKAVELGAKIVALSDINGYIHDENGLDMKVVDEIAGETGEYTLKYLERFPKAKFVSGPKNMWKVPCDIALPCATQNEIDLDDAKVMVANGVYLVAEGANMPTSLDATHYFINNGVLFAPGKAANAGGVSVSGLEMAQNATHVSWSFEEVDKMLKEIMKNIFKQAYDTAKQLDKETNLVLGANIAGFQRIYRAMVDQGVI